MKATRVLPKPWLLKQVNHQRTEGNHAMQTTRQPWTLSPARCFHADPAQRTVARDLYATVKELPLVCPLRNTLEAGVVEAATVLVELAEQGVDLAAITEQLQTDGVTTFCDSFDTLLAALVQKQTELAII